MEFFKELWKDPPQFKPSKPIKIVPKLDIEIKRTSFTGATHFNIGSSITQFDSDLTRFYRRNCGYQRNTPEPTLKQGERALWSKWNSKHPITINLEEEDDPELVEPPTKRAKMDRHNGSAMAGGTQDVEIVKVVSGNESLRAFWKSFPSKQSLLRLGFPTTRPKMSTVLQEEQREDRRKYSELLRSHVYPKVCAVYDWVRSGFGSNRPIRASNFTPTKFDRLKEVLKSQTENAQKVPETVDLEGPQESTPTTTRIQVNRRLSATPVTEAMEKPEIIEDIPKTQTPLRSLKFLPDVEFIKPDFVEEMKRKHLERQKAFKDDERTLLKSADLYSKINKAAEKQRSDKVLEDIEKKFKDYLEISETVIEEPEDEVEVIQPLPELTEEMQRDIDAALAKKNPNEVLVDSFNVRIHRRDIHTLSGLNWLNDEVINFYMNLLMERGKKENYPTVYAFNTFFYPKLVSGGHSVLKRWTKKVDIFSYDFLVAPVHLGVHWCMVVMDLGKKTVMYFDSMGGRNDQCLTALRQYLSDEKMDKKKEKLDTSDWSFICMKDIPQQMNGSDCGMFSCMYAEFTCRRAPITFTQQDMPYFRRKMIYEILKVKLLC